MRYMYIHMIDYVCMNIKFTLEQFLQTAYRNIIGITCDKGKTLLFHEYWGVTFKKNARQ